MINHQIPDPTVVVIFGAGGDLTWRKLIPALYHLDRDGWLGAGYAVLGVDRKPLPADEYRAHLFCGAQQASRSGPIPQDKWDHFASRVHYLHGDLGDPNTYQRIQAFCAAREVEWRGNTQRVFYLAIAPTLIGTVCEQLAAGPQPEAYETLLLDAMQADAGLFMRADQVETAWKLITPILESWESQPPDRFPNYSAGTWGPEAATSLLAQDGRHWIEPRRLDDDQPSEAHAGES
jgi:glucose-6-phosphate 1-dehydrogenase